jgi:DNA-binding transcriptional ArsR family regulator
MLNAFETLADPTRRRIVEALRAGERQVNDIVEIAGIQQSGVSRHLRILHEAGFVDVRPDGQRRLYRLRPEPFRELDAWLDGYRQHSRDRLHPRRRGHDATTSMQEEGFSSQLTKLDARFG